ncbi:kinase-like domain-containing protein [Circinella umbellata]|nr:kinase-like domain-containing protein [Circinella umbellata]
MTYSSPFASRHSSVSSPQQSTTVSSRNSSILLTEAALNTHNLRNSPTAARNSFNVLRDFDDHDDHDMSSESSDSSAAPPPEFTFNQMEPEDVNNNGNNSNNNNNTTTERSTTSISNPILTTLSSPPPTTTTPLKHSPSLQSLTRSTSLNTPERSTIPKTSKTKRSKFSFHRKPVRPLGINTLNSNDTNSPIGSPGSTTLGSLNNDLSVLFNDNNNNNNHPINISNNSSNQHHLYTNNNNNNSYSNNSITTSNSSILTPSIIPQLSSTLKRPFSNNNNIINDNKILKKEHGDLRRRSSMSSDSSSSSPPPLSSIRQLTPIPPKSRPIIQQHPLPTTPKPSVSIASPAPSTLPRALVKTSPSSPPSSSTKTESPWEIIIFRKKEFYQVHLIKTGGSSRVYKVICKETGNIFALKDIQMSRMEASKFESYVDEVILLQQLQGNNCVVKLEDYEVEHKKYRLRMLFEYGEIDLASYIHRNKLNIYDIRHFWRKMVEATKLLHERKIVHSDLKPGNFVLVRGNVKIIDFGIAKALTDGTVNIKRETIYGTPNYLAPEALCDIFDGLETNDDDYIDDEYEDYRRVLYKLGPPADIWALGIILYQMVYGITPFQKHPKKEEAIRKASVKYHPTSRNNEAVPPELESAIEWCLEKDPKNRPSADSLLRHPFLR